MTKLFKLPSKKEIKTAFLSFTKTEWRVFLFVITILIISTLGILQKINTSFMVSVPKNGGSLNEGMIGTPRFINPVLATSDTDLNLVSLIYSGLMRKDEHGILIPDLAKEYKISKDGLIYTFTLKDNIFFHDNKKLTTDDIVFTLNEINNPIIKSPRNGSWDGINYKKIDEKTIEFILKKPYVSFMENTTIGILPKHIWQDSPIELNEHNTNPIGTGAYMIKNINKNSDGIINSYNLTKFKKFILKSPFLKNINIYFYKNEDELIKSIKNNEIQTASSISPENAKKLEEIGFVIKTATLPRIFGLFFNQNQNPLLLNKDIIKAMNIVIDKEQIINEVLLGYATSIDSPIPKDIVNYQKINSLNKITKEEKQKKALAILEKDGWKKNNLGYLEKKIKDKNKETLTPVVFSISTSNSPELTKVAEMIKRDLESIGIKTEIKSFDIGDLNQTVIRPRDYEILLFGQIVNNESDLFAFWHSTQRKDPGLNISMYTNVKTDKILEEAFTTIDQKNRIKKYTQFDEEIKKDMPAIFLYSPNLLYVIPKDLSGVNINNINKATDRFSNIYLWYNQTDNVWKIFSKQN